MLDKLQAICNKYEELSAKSEQPDFYADPQKAARLRPSGNGSWSSRLASGENGSGSKTKPCALSSASTDGICPGLQTRRKERRREGVSVILSYLEKTR